MFQAMAELSVYLLWDGLLLLTGAAIAATILDVATQFLYLSSSQEEK